MVRRDRLVMAALASPGKAMMILESGKLRKTMGLDEGEGGLIKGR